MPSSHPSRAAIRYADGRAIARAVVIAREVTTMADGHDCASRHECFTEARRDVRVSIGSSRVPVPRCEGDRRFVPFKPGIDALL